MAWQDGVRTTVQDEMKNFNVSDAVGGPVVHASISQPG
jgi:hypothetical protein